MKRFFQLMAGSSLALLAVACTKEAPIPAKNYYPSVGITKVSGRVAAPATDTGVAVYSNTPLTWNLTMSAPDPLAEISVLKNDVVVPGYPKAVAKNTYSHQISVSQTFAADTPSVFKMTFVAKDVNGMETRRDFRVRVENFKIYRNVVLFAQDVTTADTVGLNLGRVTVGSYFSGLTGKVYDRVQAEAARSLIDLSLVGTDAGANAGLSLASTDRWNSFGESNLTQASGIKMDWRTGSRSPLDFYGRGLAESYNDSLYTKPVAKFVTVRRSANNREYVVYNADGSRVHGLVLIKRVGSVTGSTSNKKKFIVADIKTWQGTYRPV